MPLLSSPTPGLRPLRATLVAAVSVLALLAAPLAAAEPGEFHEVDPGVVAVVQPPTIGGTAQVGATLAVATDPVWSPEDAVTTYQWLRDGEPIPEPDAGDGDYTLTAADLGAAVAVQATGTKEGLGTAITVSEPTAPVAPGALVLVPGPVVDGTTRVGSTLTAHPPAWSQAGVSTTYQWLRNGKSIAGATTTKLKLASADVGTTITVRATSTKLGYTTVTTVSAPTAKISKITPIVTVGGSSTRVGALRLSITVSASPDAAPSGTVWVKQGTKLLRAKLPLTNGKASYTASGIKPGRYTYSVGYPGTSRIAGATKSTAVSIKVKTKPVIKLNPKAAPAEVTISISVTATGQPPLGGTASVKEGTKTLKSGIKITKGKATFSATAKPGTHTYRVGYNGTSQVAAGSVTVTVKVPAPIKLVSYSNCAAMQKVHPHGVGRSGAKDKTSGKPVTTFLIHTKLYEYNDGKNDKPGEKDLDRDNDGVACEKA